MGDDEDEITTDEYPLMAIDERAEQLAAGGLSADLDDPDCDLLERALDEDNDCPPAGDVDGGS